MNLCQEGYQVPEQVAETWVDPEELGNILASRAQELMCAEHGQWPDWERGPGRSRLLTGWLLGKEGGWKREVRP